MRDEKPRLPGSTFGCRMTLHSLGGTAPSWMGSLGPGMACAWLLRQRSLRSMGPTRTSRASGAPRRTSPSSGSWWMPCWTARTSMCCHRRACSNCTQPGGGCCQQWPCGCYWLRFCFSSCWARPRMHAGSAQAGLCNKAQHKHIPIGRPLGTW